MNTTQASYGSGNAVAFLFGAIFNILANTDYASLADYSIKAVIGGVIMMLFKLLGDYVSKEWITKNKSSKESKNPDLRKLRKKKRND